MAGNVWSAPIDKVSVENGPEEEEEEKGDKVEVEELEEGITNLSEYMENTSPWL